MHEWQLPGETKYFWSQVFLTFKVELFAEMSTSGGNRNECRLFLMYY